jgi:rhodanese-related sulfurtransferase|tara:strand:- start:408 stop:833 length:426 start_codon:yes stop_codon:yes gene_type:complete
MNIKNGLMLLVLLFTQLACAAEVTEVDVKGLEKLIASGVTVIDVRTPGEWKQTGIIEGSVPIMFFDEKRQAHPQQWMQQASEYIEPSTPVAIICRTGSRSKAVGNFLAKQHKYQNVYNVTGGIKDWVISGNKTIKPILEDS